MTADPVIRLAALHSSSAEAAQELLFPCDERQTALNRPSILIEDAIAALEERVEGAIVEGSTELTLSLQQAELLALA